MIDYASLPADLPSVPAGPVRLAKVVEVEVDPEAQSDVRALLEAVTEAATQDGRVVAFAAVLVNADGEFYQAWSEKTARRSTTLLGALACLTERIARHCNS